MAFDTEVFENTATSSKIVLAVLAIIIVQRVVSNYLWNKKYKLPPRVPGIPLLGNTFQVPPMGQGLWGQEVSKKYGEMYVHVLLSQRSEDPDSDLFQVYMPIRGQNLGIPEFLQSSQRHNGEAISNLLLPPTPSSSINHHVRRISNSPHAIQ